VSALKGRTFNQADGQVPTPVVVLSEHLWRTRFDSDPRSGGGEISINGFGFNVIGIAAKNFIGTEVGLNRELWVPLSMQTVLHPPQASREAGLRTKTFHEP